MRDLARELLSQGHQPVVIVPTTNLGGRWKVEMVDGVEVLRLSVLATRGLGFLRRAIGELLFSFAMMRSLRGSPYERTRWDGVVWYSPTIFLGPFVGLLKRRSRCRGYLILRDIFPEWALDLGLLRKGLAYWFFKAVAQYQYSVADVIGVQSQSNMTYLAKWARNPSRRLEVLQNWLAPAPNVGATIKIAESSLAGRRVFIYAGNMGVAQGMDFLLKLAAELRRRADIGIMFVGRGSEYERLLRESRARALTNVEFFEEIDPSEIPGLFAQCHAGLLVLDPRHRGHNIPGKFLTYMQAGLPVLARVNAGTDLIRIIETESVGQVYIGESAAEFARLAELIVDDPQFHSAARSRGRELSVRMYSPSAAATQISRGLFPGG